jgi:hypothetical protein
MTTSMTVFNVFISCPSDMQDKKQALENWIEQSINKSHEARHIQVKALTWENSTVSKMGESAQAIVNEQIGDNYDIYIGIMGKRFGSPTVKHGSGTEEEYKRAFERYKKDKSVHVAFFFEDTNIPSTASDDEWEQFTKVRTFKGELKGDGLYKHFRNVEEFVTKASECIVGHLYKPAA